MTAAITDIVNDFLKRQIEVWPQAADNYAALSNVEVKEIPLDGLTIKVQFNPARIVSSAAKVDTASVKARKCFLCAENRPAVQQGIDWGMYTILVNPFPIFPRHLTIPDKEHVDQRIAGRIGHMMQMAQALDGYTVFYNGPKCGASAPDHMHFQAGNSDFLTIGKALKNTELQMIAGDSINRLSMTTTLPLNVFVIDCNDIEKGSELFDRLYAAMVANSAGPETHSPEGEPMMNILCYTTAEGIRTVVIPRKKHRPSFYGTEGEDCMLLSPASVDMGGVFITPRREDFEKLDEKVIRTVINELCLSTDEMNKIASSIKKK